MGEEKNSTKYTVKPGDTLEGIANKMKISVKKLQELNGLTNADNIKVGQQLIIEEPLPLEDIMLRQAYAESSFDTKAKSSAGAHGLFQIQVPTMQEFNKKNKRHLTVDSLYIPETNMQVRDWYMNVRLPRGEWLQKEQSEKVRMAKLLAAYNYGPGNVIPILEKAKAQGYDIYYGLDWIKFLPKETRDYVDFVLNKKDVNWHKNLAAYELALKVKQAIVDLLKKYKSIFYKSGGKLNYVDYLTMY